MIGKKGSELWKVQFEIIQFEYNLQFEKKAQFESMAHEKNIESTAWICKFRKKLLSGDVIFISPPNLWILINFCWAHALPD